MDTMQKLANGALQAQNACNLSGVAHSMSATLDELWAHAHKLGKGTDWVNTHPISILYSTQIAWLASGAMANCDVYYKAHNACTEMAENDEEDG